MERCQVNHGSPAFHRGLPGWRVCHSQGLTHDEQTVHSCLDEPVAVEVRRDSQCKVDVCCSFSEIVNPVKVMYDLDFRFVVKLTFSTFDCRSLRKRLRVSELELVDLQWG